MSGKNVSRYENTRIVSARALQISQGSPVLVKVPRGVTRPVDIAELERQAGVIPIDIRPLESKKKEK